MDNLGTAAEQLLEVSKGGPLNDNATAGGAKLRPGSESHARSKRAQPVNWPQLSELMLTAEAKKDRMLGVGGSDANVIFSGDPQRIRDLWLEKRGEKEPEYLSASLPVVLGNWTEPLNRQWYERVCGQTVGRIGEVVTSAQQEWRRCTIDGYVETCAAVWEAKHTSAFRTMDQVLERYMPQLQHNMAVVGSQTAILSVIFGNHKFEIVEVASDWLYQLELLDAESQFWDDVLTGREPVPTPPPAVPRPVGIREVCLEGNNAWASAAVDWLQHREAAKSHATACSTVKSLVEDDVARAFGHGIEAKRSRSGAITIRECA